MFPIPNFIKRQLNTFNTAFMKIHEVEIQLKILI